MLTKVEQRLHFHILAKHFCMADPSITLLTHSCAAYEETVQFIPHSHVKHYRPMTMNIENLHKTMVMIFKTFILNENASFKFMNFNANKNLLHSLHEQ